ncbi:hypothetical protein [Mycolicibacterium austroafricanum]|uniref:hypothetical protein n=1 Tax=Mycolicibacterium austroafricanum TaxID=39687 RepID=UPI001ABF6FDD|nr:hypothetical protein [Mycolicibacterium austroafricanum]QRZ05894.1 hypothetical protein JN090_23690 [Mycolicibacterium austroafricanum]
MSFGGQTVTFVTVTESGEPGFGGIREKVRTETAVTGCRFRPLRAEETPDYLTNIATGVWKCTAPAVETVLAAEPDGEVKVSGVTYQIVGPVRPKPDMGGATHHVTILCRRSET